MEAGYYWGQRIDYAWPVEVVLIRHGNAWITGSDVSYPINAFSYLGKVLPYRAPVARIQSPYAPDGKTLVSFRVNVPGGKNNGSSAGLPWQWIVRAYNTREARKVLCKTFAMHRTPHGTTFTRINAI